MRQWLSPDTERAAALLEAHPDYRILRSLPPLDLLPLPAAEGRVRTAAVLDTETTSLDPATGHIIELAICHVSFDARGRIVGIGPVQDWLEDPGYPLPPQIAALTGLTDADLAGRRIDDAAALDLLSGADLIVAHNASFDAAWIERRNPSVAGKPWVCSLKDIDWRGHGYEGRQLGALLGEVAGFFNTRHRADADVAALVALLATTLPSGRTACSEMILSAQRPTVRLIANGAPFEVKDRLKARGYRWNPKIRCWWIEVAGSATDDERAWLAAEAGCHRPTLREITWHQRHRT
ncbi:DNA polymerase III subunit epsilon [Sphingomonas koreensis]|uniref:DNA polymerase III subunit epsilon n=1 Tax=Sphingomonas koreensis TaxID=93064 RepID=A0A430G7S9_9SPHN|nr:3'-5' exonuclease [Sphingomonas koreensis]RSY89561.1 DNA polymerase III subunit epsilon [Sphingomonas koreensis]